MGKLTDVCLEVRSQHTPAMTHFHNHSEKNSILTARCSNFFFSLQEIFGAVGVLSMFHIIKYFGVIRSCSSFGSSIHVTDVTDRACACLKSVLCIGVDKDHKTSNWVLIFYQT